ncbi:peptide chain release factor N(5)-glutamine methyltransferase [Gordonia sp. zg691]|uniref:peptide chain release factor N(5)-glutamine methyltransferase n=1 Tax=Gordonia jinghuaiqii TaxID=2758710 RepID=UPI0016624430|nr:peptide chain release factor N(5)-glutamine methyltransferase [Gordonia jinghuaiqii]MBD0863701.1 peptide chain release factor N(5)-glutamine methyltransferase [Gordonia jinghuaiqii]
MSAPTGVVDELRSATAQLAQAGIDSARGDAEWLMAHVLDTDPGRLVVIDEIDDAHRRAFRAAVSRRAQRIPLQHIVGTAAFGPIELAVGPGVFIPRPETEYLLEWVVTTAVPRARALAQADTSPGPLLIADLCSGSGALAISIATMIPDARVIAVEADEDALLWLRRNVADAPPAVGARVEVVAADVTDADRIAEVVPGGVSVIVSNPPYVPLDAGIGPEVAHDPARAVFGGADGMSVIVPMTPVIATMLVPGGFVGIEHDDTTSEAVVECLLAHGGFDEVTPRNDLTGRPRFVTARRTAP